MSEKKNNSWPMTRQQSFIAAAVFVGFFVLWFLWAAVGPSVICWIEDHPGIASWVQAVGSISAIWFAFYVARYQAILSEKKALIARKKRIRAYAVVIEKIKKCFGELNNVFNSYNAADWFFHSWENPLDRFNEEEFDFLINQLLSIDIEIYDDAREVEALLELKIAVVDIKPRVKYLASLSQQKLEELYSQEPNHDHDDYDRYIFAKINDSCKVLLSMG